MTAAFASLLPNVSQSDHSPNEWTGFRRSRQSGDEVVGLTRAFLFAGTPSVLASLWSVYSEATKDLMVAFYGYLEQGLDKAEALRAAQRDVRKTHPHPAFWTAFNLIGDWRWKRQLLPGQQG